LASSLRRSPSGQRQGRDLSGVGARFRTPCGVRGRRDRKRRRSRPLLRSQAADKATGSAAACLANRTRVPQSSQGGTAPFVRARPDREPAKTHGKLAIEDLNVAGLIRNVRLGRAISDAAWTEFSRQLRYEASWLDGEPVVCDRWFPSTRSCSRCGTVERPIPLAQRIFRCRICGLVADRDRNAAANLAAWAQASGVVADEAPDRQAGGRVTNAPGGEGAGRPRDGATGPDERGTDTPACTRVEDTREGWRSSNSSPLFNALRIAA
jgi:putative transposase